MAPLSARPWEMWLVRLLAPPMGQQKAQPMEPALVLQTALPLGTPLETLSEQRLAKPTGRRWAMRWVQRWGCVSVLPKESP